MARKSIAKLPIIQIQCSFIRHGIINQLYKLPIKHQHRGMRAELGKFAPLYSPKSISLTVYNFFFRSTLKYWRDDNTGHPTSNIWGSAIDTFADKQKKKNYNNKSSLLSSKRGCCSHKNVFTSNLLHFFFFSTNHIRFGGSSTFPGGAAPPAPRGLEVRSSYGALTEST